MTLQDTRGSQKASHLFDANQAMQEGHRTYWEIFPFHGSLSK